MQFLTLITSLVAMCTVSLAAPTNLHTRDYRGSEASVLPQYRAKKAQVSSYGNPTVSNTYTYYRGPASSFPAESTWISFDRLWTENMEIIRNSCVWNGWAINNEERYINWMKGSIWSVAEKSGVDQRVILATIIQESKGCIRAPTTRVTHRNPGLMQSHDGVEFNPSKPATTIKQMIIDGTQGVLVGQETNGGDGLVQLINQQNGNIYEALRKYNSGSVDVNDLDFAYSATKCYVSDVANRLQGWTDLKGARTCA